MEPMEIESSEKGVRPSAFLNIPYIIRNYDSRFLIVFGMQNFNAGLHLAFNIAYQYMYKEHFKVSPAESQMY